MRDTQIRLQPSTLPFAPPLSHFLTNISAASQWFPWRISRDSVRGDGVSSGSVSGSGLSGISVSGDVISGSGIFRLPLSLDVNIHLVVRLDVDVASAATKTSVAALAAAADDGGCRPITIPIPCGKTRWR